MSDNIRARTSTLVKKVRLQAETSAFVVESDGQVRAATATDSSTLDITASHDMLPVPLDSPQRTFGWLTTCGYWLGEGFGIGQFQIASSYVQAGLSPGAVCGAILLGNFIVSLGCAANGYVGARFGINLPAYARTAWGIRGTYFVVVCRAVAAIVWFGTQSYQGGQCTTIMITAIWPRYKHLPNHLPASAHVTSQGLLSFFIFWIVQLPLLYLPTYRLRYLFLAKIFIMPALGLAWFGWAVGRAHGFGSIFDKGTHIKNGTPVAVVFLQAMTSCISSKSTLALNLCDTMRYAKSPRLVVVSCILVLTFLITLPSILGVIVSSAVEVIYGKSVWSPLQIMPLFGSRAAQFFSALCWAWAVVVTNIASNSLAVANDMMILFPSWVNVRRGQYITAVLGVVTCPWTIQATAKTFTSFLSGYTIFLAPLGGILMADFYLIRRRRISLPDIFLGRQSVYWYSSGVNPRAALAFALGIAPTLPGFCKTINPKLSIPIAATYVSAVVYPVGVVIGASAYLLLSFVFPPHPLPTDYTAPQYGSSSLAYAGSYASDGKDVSGEAAEVKAVAEV
ncbi:hypothetical protein JCM10207_000370 [Rhodosporidiobolus poonsookiae]